MNEPFEEREYVFFQEIRDGERLEKDIFFFALLQRK